MPTLCDHPLWFISLKFTGLPGPVQAALITISISALVFVLGYIHATRPILVFIRRPDDRWRIANIGRGAAFDIRFEDRAFDGSKFKRNRLYPIADKEVISLGDLNYGDQLTVYYATRSGLRRYKTVCREWVHSFEKLWFAKLPAWEEMADETRLVKREVNAPPRSSK